MGETGTVPIDLNSKELWHRFSVGQGDGEVEEGV